MRNRATRRKSRDRQGAVRGAWTLGALLAASLLAGCSKSPAPPEVTQQQATTSAKTPTTDPVPAGASKPAPRRAAQSTWTDHATGLMWATEDNGYDLDWNQASTYCQNLRLGGHEGWRLPALSELNAIFDPSQTDVLVSGGNNYEYHIKGKIKLSGWWTWSATPDGPRKAQVFVFLSGNHDSGLLFAVLNLRALCVRSAK